jgi:GEVED domain/Secretion system C-terminal sorting domain
MSQHVLKFLKIFSVCSIAILGTANANAQTYCTATASSCGTDHINSFSTTGGVNNITNNSTGCSVGYSYYNTKKHTQVAGLSVNFTLTMGASFTQYGAIYVDYNQNGLFTDVGEQVYTSGTSKISSFSGSFTIPITASTGTTRMRVVADYSASNPNPCGTRTWGEIEDYDFEILSPCTAIATVTNSTPGSKSVTVNWSAVTGSAGYEYKVSTSSAAPSGSGTPTSSTTALITGLLPATNYCVFVRNKCDATAYSQWKSTCFTTSNCSAPAVSFANITENSALAFWSTNPIATQYEYIYGTDAATPGTGINGTTTTSNSFSMPGLLPETAYYVHIRTKCTGNEISTWETFQFSTTPACKAPDVTIIDFGPLDKQATWQPVHTAVAYEYAVTTSEMPPSLGTTHYSDDVSFSIGNDNKPYYFHIRSKCISIFNTSDWATTTLREPPATSIRDINEGDGLQFTVYPNPVSNVLTAKLDGVEEYTGTVSVMDVTGKTVYTNDMKTPVATIDMSGFTAGNYIIRYTNANTNRIIKIVKQ